MTSERIFLVRLHDEASRTGLLRAPLTLHHAGGGWSFAPLTARPCVLEGTPAAVQAIETSGEYLDTNPHIHAIVTDGLFRTDGTFLPMPGYSEGARMYLLSLWKKAVAEFVTVHQFITPEVAGRSLRSLLAHASWMNKILGWQHTGFSVFAERRVDFKKSDDASVKEMRQLARYISKPPFTLENITWKPGADRVIYRGSGLHKWHKQNFETFEVFDFIAAVTAHIPNHRQKYVSYYGEYSNKTRGWKKKRGCDGFDANDTSPSEAQAKFRQSWAGRSHGSLLAHASGAVLVQKVWEVDPLACPKCGKAIKVVAIVGAFTPAIFSSYTKPCVTTNATQNPRPRFGPRAADVLADALYFPRARSTFQYWAELKLLSIIWIVKAFNLCCACLSNYAK